MAVSPFDAVLAPRRSTSRSAWLRALPIAVCGIAVALVLVASASSPSPAIEPDLATLLRGMALVKASIVAVAAVAAGWRFGRPIRLAATLGYLGGLAAMAGATALVWQLTGLVAASIAFHGGLLAVLVVAWRLDPDGSNARRSR